MQLQVLESTLRKYFGYSKFRNGQVEIINSVLNKQDTLVVMPTGGGKSICYQIPALVMKGCAIVISPLISLMKDQVDTLVSAKVPSTMINSSISTQEMLARIEAAKNNKYKLLYVAPERLESRAFIETINSMNISFFAIDEAHCISEWGHDFRPSYLNIPNSFAKNRKFPIIALTATATPDVQNDIVDNLKLVAPNRYIRGFNRINLKYFTETIYDKYSKTADIILNNENGSNIIYCGSRKRVENFTRELINRKINVEPYHGGMKPLIRDVIQDRFINGKTKTIIATSAFGMGIDKSDVRNVIHVDLTPTLEAYYQEAGRAGRDGLMSNCFMLYNESDYSLQDFFLKTTFPLLDEIEKVYDYLCTSSFDNGNNSYLIKQEIVNVANSIGLSIRTVESVLGLLDRNKIIAENYQKNSAKIQFLADRDRIFEYYNNSTVQRQLVLDSLLRSVNTEVYYREVDFDIDAIANKHDVNQDDLLKAIESMKFSGLLNFRNMDSFSPYRLLVKENSIKDLPIDFEKYLLRRQLAYKKLDTVVEYAQTNECKRNFILKYFEENDVVGQCDNCTSCLSLN